MGYGLIAGIRVSSQGQSNRDISRSALGAVFRLLAAAGDEEWDPAFSASDLPCSEGDFLPPESRC